MTAIQVAKSFLAEIDKMCTRFLWCQDEQLTGRKCNFKWSNVCITMDKGGLGILDTTKFAKALRLRWLCQTWKSPDRPWVGTELPCNHKDIDLFAAATSVIIGNGETTKFWGRSMALLIPPTHGCSHLFW
uniref:Uncharacterized protein n=1 Tax=Aegilops tauschii subsp. strangulata TaxID=200361 RepID=A0A453HIJ0_AEGTS